MIDSEEPIDLDRVVFDPIYRRDVIDYLNRQETGVPRRTIAWSSRGDRGMVAGSIRGGREAAVAVAQAKP
jgi:hypothetical protein